MSNEQDSTSAMVRTSDEPDTELAIVLLASGCNPRFVKTRANFPSVQAVRLFARDEDTRQAIRERRAERTERVADRALVALDRLLTRPLKDTKAHVMAIRTALGVGQAWHREQAPSSKRVEELTVTELETLIAMTRREIDRRTAIEPA